MHGSRWHATEGAEGGRFPGARSLIIVHKGGRKRQLAYPQLPRQIKMTSPSSSDSDSDSECPVGLKGKNLESELVCACVYTCGCVSLCVYVSGGAGPIL